MPRRGDAGFLLLPSEVARAFGVDVSTVRRWAEAGMLAAVRSGGRQRRYREAEVRALLERQARL